MDVDNPDLESERDKDGFVIVSSPTSPLRSSTPQSPAEGSSSQPPGTSNPGELVDIEMRDSSRLVNRITEKTASILSPRKTAGTSDSSMMFGKFAFIAIIIYAEQFYR
jgi:ubiquitin carboxyl-terminal hydrolase 25/28